MKNNATMLRNKCFAKAMALMKLALKNVFVTYELGAQIKGRFIFEKRGF